MSHSETEDSSRSSAELLHVPVTTASGVRDTMISRTTTMVDKASEEKLQDVHIEIVALTESEQSKTAPLLDKDQELIITNPVSLGEKDVESAKIKLASVEEKEGESAVMTPASDLEKVEESTVTKLAASMEKDEELTITKAASLIEKVEESTVTKPASESIDPHVESDPSSDDKVSQSNDKAQTTATPLVVSGAEASVIRDGKAHSRITENVDDSNQSEAETLTDKEVHRVEGIFSGENVLDMPKARDTKHLQSTVSKDRVHSLLSGYPLVSKVVENPSDQPALFDSGFSKIISTVERNNVTDVAGKIQHQGKRESIGGDSKLKVDGNKTGPSPTSVTVTQTSSSSTQDYSFLHRKILISSSGSAGDKVLNLATEHAYTKSSTPTTNLCTASNFTKTTTTNSASSELTRTAARNLAVTGHAKTVTRDTGMEDTVLAGPFYLTQPNNPVGIPVCVRVPVPKVPVATTTKPYSGKVLLKSLQESTYSNKSLFPNSDQNTNTSTAQSMSVTAVVRESAGNRKDRQFSMSVPSLQRRSIAQDILTTLSADMPIQGTERNVNMICDNTDRKVATTAVSIPVSVTKDKPFNFQEWPAAASRTSSSFLLTNQGIVLTTVQSTTAGETLAAVNYHNKHGSVIAPMESVSSHRNKPATLYSKDGKNIIVLTQTSHPVSQKGSQDRTVTQNVSSNSVQSMLVKQQMKPISGFVKLSESGILACTVPQLVSTSNSIGQGLISSNDISTTFSGTSLVVTPSTVRPISSSGMQSSSKRAAKPPSSSQVSQNPSIIILKTGGTMSKQMSLATSVSRVSGLKSSAMTNVSPDTVVTVVHARKSEPSENTTSMMLKLAGKSSEPRSSLVSQSSKLSAHLADISVRQDMYGQSVSQFPPPDNTDRAALKNPVYSTTVKTGQGTVPIMVVTPNLDDDSSDSSSEKDLRGLDLSKSGDIQKVSEDPELSSEETDSDIEIGATEEQDMSVLVQLLKSSTGSPGLADGLKRETFQSSIKKTHCEQDKHPRTLKPMVPKAETTNMCLSGKNLAQQTSTPSRPSVQDQGNQSPQLAPFTKHSLLFSSFQPAARPSGTYSLLTQKDSEHKPCTLPPTDNLPDQGYQSMFSHLGTREGLLQSMLRNSVNPNDNAEDHYHLPLGTEPDRRNSPEPTEDDDCFGIRIESVYSLSEQTEIEDVTISKEEKSEHTFYKIQDEDLWKTAVQPCFVVLERLSKSESAGREPLNQSRCSKHCRKRTLDYLCNLHLLTCNNHPDMSLFLKPKKLKLSKPTKMSKHMDPDSLKTSSKDPIEIKDEVSCAKSRSLTQVLRKTSVGWSVSQYSSPPVTATTNHLSVPVISLPSDLLYKSPPVTATPSLDSLYKSPPVTAAPSSDSLSKLPLLTRTPPPDSLSKLSSVTITPPLDSFSKSSSLTRTPSDSLSRLPRLTITPPSDSLTKSPSWTRTASDSPSRISATSTTTTLQGSTAYSPPTSGNSTPYSKVVPAMAPDLSFVKQPLMENVLKPSVTEQKETPTLIESPVITSPKTCDFQWHFSQLQSQVQKKRELMQKAKHSCKTRKKQKEKKTRGEKKSDSQKSAPNSEKLKISPSFIMQGRNSKKSHETGQVRKSASSAHKSSANVAQSNSPTTTTKGALPKIVPQGTFIITKSSGATVLTPSSSSTAPGLHQPQMMTLPAEKVKAAVSSLSSYLAATGRKVNEDNAQYILLKIGNQHVLVKISPNVLTQHTASGTKSGMSTSGAVGIQQGEAQKVVSAMQASFVKTSTSGTSSRTSSNKKVSTPTPSQSSSAKRVSTSTPSQISSAKKVSTSTPSQSSSARKVSTSTPSQSSSAKKVSTSTPSQSSSARKVSTSTPSQSNSVGENSTATTSQASSVEKCSTAASVQTDFVKENSASKTSERSMSQPSAASLSHPSSSSIFTHSTTPTLVSLLTPSTATHPSDNPVEGSNNCSENASGQVEPTRRATASSASGTQDCPTSSRKRGYDDSSSILSHLPPNSTMLPERKVKNCTLTEAERRVKRRRLEIKYPLPPGITIKSEPDDPGYEESFLNNCPITNSTTVLPTATPSPRTGVTTPVMAGPSCLGEGTIGRAGHRPFVASVGNSRSSATEQSSDQTLTCDSGQEQANNNRELRDSTFELESVLLSETMGDINDNMEATSEEPPPLIDERSEEAVPYSASLAGDDDTNSTEEMPPLLLPMFTSSSSSLPEPVDTDSTYKYNHPIQDSLPDKDRTATIASENDPDVSKIGEPSSSMQSHQSVSSIDSGSSLLARSASSSVSGIISLPGHSPAPTSVNLKIQRLKELLKKKEQEVENMRKRQSEWPVLDIDDY